MTYVSWRAKSLLDGLGKETHVAASTDLHAAINCDQCYGKKVKAEMFRADRPRQVDLNWQIVIGLDVTEDKVTFRLWPVG